MVVHDMSLKGTRFGLPAATVKIMEEQMGPWFMGFLKYYKKKAATRVGMAKPAPYPSANPFVPLVITGTTYDFISKAKAKKHNSDIVNSIVAAVIMQYDHTQRLKAVMNQFLAVCHAHEWIVNVWHEHHLHLHDGQFRDGAGLKGDGGAGNSQQVVANPLHNYPTGLDFQNQDAALACIYSIFTKCPGFMAVTENDILEDVMDEEITDLLEQLGKRMRFNLGQCLLATYFQAVQPNDLPDISELHPKSILHYPPSGITTAKQMKEMAKDKYRKKPWRGSKGIKLMHTVQPDSNDKVDTEMNTTGDPRLTNGKGKAICRKRSRPYSCSPSPNAPVLKKANRMTAPNDGAVVDAQVQMPGRPLNVKVMPPASMISQAGPLTQHVTPTQPSPAPAHPLTEKPSSGNIDMDGTESPGTMMGASKAHPLNDQPVQEDHDEQQDPEEDDDVDQQTNDDEQDASVETEGQGQPQVDMSLGALIGPPGVGDAIISDARMTITDHALDRRSADMEEPSSMSMETIHDPLDPIPSLSDVDPGPAGTQGWTQVMDIVAKADAQEALERQKKQQAHLAAFSKFKKDWVKTNFAGDTEDSLDNLEVEDPVISHPPPRGAKAANPGDGTSKFQRQPRTLKVGHSKASPFVQQPQPSDPNRPGPSMRAGSVTAKQKGKKKA
ncbi:hypothetical protein K439DRAFT_1612136 [Ramaria rubella]|nr:hypothetical protein K439DRAFT_1612136 [Ramaria rubella]